MYEKNKDFGKYAHEGWGRTFLEKHYKNQEIIINAGAYHHNPKKEHGPLIKVIQLADWLSSGEREEEFEDIENDNVNRKRQHLESVYNYVNLSKGNKRFNKKMLKYQFVTLDKIKGLTESEEPANFLRKSFLSLENEPNTSYNNLREFIKEFEGLTSQQKNDLNILDSLLKKYLWCVPSATRRKDKKIIPVVSLYNHLKTTSAITTCLLKAGTINKITKLQKRNNKTNEFLDTEEYFSLIHGDLSGLQDFIFSIVSKSALKTLKGRSTYLGLLNNLLSRKILKELGLPITNLLFEGGGHFYILSHKICDKEIKKIRDKINHALFKEFGTKLFLALGKIDLKLNDFQRINGELGISKKWKEVNNETGKLKRRKHEQEKIELFKPKGEGGVITICPVCHEEIRNYVSTDGELFCKNCNSFKELSEEIKDFQKNEIVDYRKLRKLPLIKRIITELRLNKEYLNFKGLPFIHLPQGIPVYENQNSIITFEDLAIGNSIKKEKSKEEEDEINKKGLLGILKMDVDNLGLIFTNGLKEKASISLMTDLSFMTSLFFQEVINYLLRKKEYKNKAYLIFSGGDDLFVLGEWKTIIRLSLEIRECFKAWTCGNPHINLSAGISIVKPKYSVKLLAKQTEEMLEKSKKMQGKNCITIMNKTIKWIETKNSLENTIRLWDALIKLNKEFKLPSQFLQRIKQFQEFNTPNKAYRYIWLLKYYLKRTIKNEQAFNKLDEEIIKKLFEEPLKNSVLNNYEPNDFNYVLLSARLAELQLKQENGERNGV